MTISLHDQLKSIFHHKNTGLIINVRICQEIRYNKLLIVLKAIIFTVCTVHKEQISFIISISEMFIELPCNDRKACMKCNSCKKKDYKFNKIGKRT